MTVLRDLFLPVKRILDMSVLKQLASFAVMSVWALSLVSCADSEIDEAPYDAILSQYVGHYYINSFEWLGGDNLPDAVDVDGDGIASSDLIAESAFLEPSFRLSGAKFWAEYGLRRGRMCISFPVLDYVWDGVLWSDPESRSSLHQPVIEIRMELDTDLIANWGWFDAFDGKDYVAEFVRKNCRNGGIVDASPDGFVFEVSKYLVIDRISGEYLVGPVRATFSRVNTL